MIRKILRYFKNRPDKSTQYEANILKGLVHRSHYAYCCYNAAKLASKLNHKKISVIEFGCAGGGGLLDLERICSEISLLTNISFEIYGFDSGEGLPKPEGYRDLPYQWRQGFFKMNQKILESKITQAKIIYGDVKHTVKKFFEQYNPAVIGCVFHDLDYYSSTKSSLELFNENEKHFLPRSFHYFDDIIGNDVVLYSEWTGERLAINEFNKSSDTKKFDNCYHLTTMPNALNWYHQIRILHLFNHPNYCDFVSDEDQQIPIK